MFTTLSAPFTRSAKTSRFVRSLACGLGLIAGGGSLVGCAPPRPAVTVIVGLDTSDSARSGLQSGALTAASVAERLRAKRDSFKLFRVDNDCRQFGSGQTIGDAEATLQLIQEGAKPRSDRRGTLPEKFWQQTDDEVSAASGDSRPVVLVLVTDGDNDDLRAESSQHITRRIAHLAKSRRVRGVVLFGVNPANMATLRKQFAPLGERLRLIPAGENDPDAAAGVIMGCAAAAAAPVAVPGGGK